MGDDDVLNMSNAEWQRARQKFERREAIGRMILQQDAETQRYTEKLRQQHPDLAPFDPNPRKPESKPTKENTDHE